MCDSPKIRYVLLDKPFMENFVDDLVSCIEGWAYATWQRANFLIELPKKWEYSFVVYQENTICGFCIASGKLPDFYYIHLIFLRDECRNQGLGRQMLDRAWQYCREHALVGIRLRCPVSNEVAYRFYLDYGFTLLEHVHDEISGDEPDFVLEYRVAQG